MPETSAASVLQDLAVLLVIAAAATIVFQRLKLPVVAGYLTAGILAGQEITRPLIADPGVIRSLAEIGVVMVMVSVGLEFRVRRVARLGARVGMTALIEVGLMLALGYGAARLIGWSTTDALLAAGVVAISSTTVIAKVFEERSVDWRVKDLVFGVLILEDIIAIIIVAVATTVALGNALDAESLGRLLGRLALLLVAMAVVGMLTVPSIIRAVVRLERTETTLVTAVGITFLAALITHSAGYSVALGAFVAGTLMAESGVGHQVGEVLRPVRDLFAAVFFVAVGMLLDVDAAVAAAPWVILFSIVVVGGKILGVSVGAFLAGFGTRRSVQAAMRMAQIGEFSFIIAGLGVAGGTATSPLYAVAVATAMVTAFLTPWLAGRSEATAMWLDRRLPAPLQTFSTLYASWLETLTAERGAKSPRRRARRLLRLVVLDAAVVAGSLVLTSLAYRGEVPWLRWLDPGTALGRLVILGAGAVIAAPFGVGLVLAARRLATQLAESVIPPVAAGKVDQGRAPRRVLLVTLEIAVTVAVGIPLVVVTLPFLPPYGAPGVIVAVLLLLGLAFWRTARDLDSHTRAGAELVAHVLGRRGAKDPDGLAEVQGMLPGLGEFLPLTVEEASPVAGRTLGELNLRGQTGATVVAVVRGDQRVAYPDADLKLEAGDLVAVTGTHQAIVQAEALLLAQRVAESGQGTDGVATPGSPAAPA
ncbi:MAG: cation:proton antiporter [Gemmatimonadales bacterium]